MALANKIGANGTPAFRINGVDLTGAQPFDKFKEVIDKQLAKAQTQIASGTRPTDVYVTLTNKNQGRWPGQAGADRRQAGRGRRRQDRLEGPRLGDAPVRGPKDALVTIVEFSDFQCPFCKRVEDTLKQVAETYGDKVRFVWKDKPLPFHPRAEPAAKLAREAYTQKGDKGFWDAHDTLFASNPKLEDADLEGIAAKLGLNWDNVKTAIDSNKYGDRIDAERRPAGDLQASGTPHFFVNGVRLGGAQPFEKFQKMIDEELAKAKGLVAKGSSRAKVYDALMKDGKGPPPPEKKDVPAPDASSAGQGRQEREGRDPGVHRLPVPVLQARRADRPSDRERVRRQGEDRLAPHAAPDPPERAARRRGRAGGVHAEGLRRLLEDPRQAVQRRGRRRGPHRSREPREVRQEHRPRHGQVQGGARQQHAQGQDRRGRRGRQQRRHQRHARVRDQRLLHQRRAARSAFKKLINRALKEAEGK